MGRNFSSPETSGRKLQKCPREIQTKKFMFVLSLLPDMRGNALETVPSGPYFGCAESFLKEYCQGNAAKQSREYGSGTALAPLTPSIRMQLFCLQLGASCLQWSFLTYSFSI